MNRQIQRAIHKRQIFGDYAPHKVNRLCNSFGWALGERFPTYQNVRRLCRAQGKPTDHKNVKLEARAIRKFLQDMH